MNSIDLQHREGNCMSIERAGSSSEFIKYNNYSETSEDLGHHDGTPGVTEAVVDVFNSQQRKLSTPRRTQASMNKSVSNAN